MAHVQTLNEQNALYQRKKGEILVSGHRFAVVDSSSINYYDSEKALYKDYPCFKPTAEAVYGTLPLLIDIDAETNSRRHQRRTLREKISNFNEELFQLLERGQKLAEEEQRLNSTSSRNKAH